MSIATRVMAKFIDLGIALTLAAILYPVGPILGFLYSLLADGIQWGRFEGQSVGKRLMRLQVIHRVKEEPAGFRESIFRNAPVGIVTALAIIPFWGWLLLALIGIPLMAMEIYLMVKVEEGHRLGDVMGDTEVVEFKPR